MIWIKILDGLFKFFTNKWLYRVIGLLAVIFFSIKLFFWAWDKLAYSNPKVRVEMIEKQALLNNNLLMRSNIDSLTVVTSDCKVTIDSINIINQKNIKALMDENKELKLKEAESNKMINHWLEVSPCVETITEKNGIFKKRTTKKLLVDCPEQ